MAGDWIKMRGNLWDDPRVARLCDLTDCGEAQVIGGLYWLWATADQHTEDGVMPGLTLRQIDRKVGIPGFGAALCHEDVRWLVDAPGGVVITKFEEHNGSSAKRRSSDAQRKASGRNVSATDADKLRTESGGAEDELRRSAELEKEKRREREKKGERASSPQPFAPAPAREAEPPDKAQSRLQALAIEAVHGMQAAGLADAYPEDPELLALLRQGATPAELAEAAGVGVARGKGKGWVFARVVGKRIDAAQPGALPQVSPGVVVVPPGETSEEYALRMARERQVESMRPKASAEVVAASRRRLGLAEKLQRPASGGAG